jgi:hypothetical protein
MERDGIGRLARQDPHGRFDLQAPGRDLDDVFRLHAGRAAVTTPRCAALSTS